MKQSPEHQSTHGLRRLLSAWIIVLLAGLMGCTSHPDGTTYIPGQTNRSFTDAAFDPDALLQEKDYHVVVPDYPNCSFTIGFLDADTVQIKGRQYGYLVEEGRIVVHQSGRPDSEVVTFEVGPDNTGSSDFIAVQHQFPDADTAAQSGLWIGSLPADGPVEMDALWYRTHVRVGSSPGDIRLIRTEKGDYLYAVNSSDDSLSVIRVPENRVAATIPVQRYPYRMAAAPDGSYLYVTNAWDNSLSIIRTDTNQVIKNLPVGQDPNGVVVTADGGSVLVAGTSDRSISVIQTSDHTPVQTIPMDAKALAYIEVFFSSQEIAPGTTYTLLAVEDDCSALLQEPDFGDPLCQQNPVSGSCSTKCPASMGTIALVFDSVTPDENGFWCTDFLTDQFKTRTYSLFLVENFSARQGVDLDGDDNGVMDFQENGDIDPPWDQMVDAVGVRRSSGHSGFYANVALTVSCTDSLCSAIPAGFSRIPNGKDTDTAGDWVADNGFGCWLSPIYKEGLAHLSDIPHTGRAWNSPGEPNLREGFVDPADTPADHPVINEFVIGRRRYTPMGLAAPAEPSADGASYVYVSTQENMLLKIRLNDFRIVSKVAAGGGNVDMAILPDGTVYMADNMQTSIIVVQGEAVTGRLQTGTEIRDIAASADGRYVFVTHSAVNQLSVIRTDDQAITDMIQLDAGATGVTAFPEGNFVYLTNERQNTVTVVTYTDDQACP